MKKAKTVVLVAAVVVLILLAYSLEGALSYRVDEGGQADWLNRQWEEYRASGNFTTLSDGTLLAELKEDDLIYQVWQVSLDGNTYYDTVVWKRGGSGRYQAAMDQVISQQEQRGETIHFHFQDGVWQRRFQVTPQFQITAVERTLHPPIGLILCVILLAAAMVAALVVGLRKRA